MRWVKQIAATVVALAVLGRATESSSKERIYNGWLKSYYVCIVDKPGAKKDYVFVKACPCNSPGEPYAVKESDLKPFYCPDDTGAKRPKE